MDHLEYLKVFECQNKIRLGVNTDGGYILIDNLGDYDCYISAGISYEESFSRDFIKKYDMNKSNSFGFDGTIDQYPTHYTENIEFIKKNIGSDETQHTTNLSSYIDKYNEIFLKMDIEGGEYPWINYLNEQQLSKFKQIVIEFHNINRDGHEGSHKNKIECFRKLSNTHYLVHAHGNAHSHTTNNIPDVIELTYVNKSILSEPNLNTTPLPIPNLDFTNRPGSNDINLNFEPFVKQN
jgi:hypothetical protein